MLSVRSLFPVLESDACSFDSQVTFLGKSGVDFDSKQYDLIKSQFNASKIFRMSFFLTDKNKLVFTAPCGPDKSEGLDDLVFCVHAGLSLLCRLGIEPKIGIISGGRGGDLGRSAVVDQTIHDAESLLHLLQKENISATHYTILIEDAVIDADFLILPDSLSGEMILKTVAGIGAGREIGNVLILKKESETEMNKTEMNENKMNLQTPLFIEQITKNANEEDALILKEAFSKS